MLHGRCHYPAALPTPCPTASTALTVCTYLCPPPLPHRRQLASLLSASAGSTANGGSHALPNGGAGSALASGASSAAGAAAAVFESHLWPCLDRCFASHFRCAAKEHRASRVCAFMWCHVLPSDAL